MTEIKATVFSKTGEKTNFVYNCADVDGKPSLKEIHKSSVQLQQELNKFLTTLVEKEKSKTGMHSAVFNVEINIYYVRKFVSDLRQVCGFLWVFWLPQPIKLNTTI
jgi:hypothetical protein